MNKVLETESFTKAYEKWSREERDWIEKMRTQLTQNLFVGKPLGFEWFREKKFGNKRLYFFINPSKNRAILVSYGNKKEQRQMIANILSNKENYFSMLD